MNQKSLYLWIRAAIAGLALCGGVMIFYGYHVLVRGRAIIGYRDYLTAPSWPWIAFICTAAVPCYIVLLFAWRISAEIKKDNSFSKRTADLLKKISIVTFADSAWFFIGSVLYFVFYSNNLSVLFISLVIVFIGVFIALAAAILSHFVLKAADLQEQSDATV